ncbi:major facilitator superfamily transporter [Halalkalicoccus paucihalophilus]|uniref:Major facilitator superfamily transporter n=1 Tax=Halalkalicoccus paucihalophilus TaxID=1008153 RepID=A0A151AJL7_9EURY|nr:major facilitator superfamily transporter [Halalkalicoccus paucihalophilus]
MLIYGLYTDSRKDRVMGLRGSANSVGAAVWPLLGGALGTLAWQLPFGVYLLGLPLGILAALTVPDVSPAGSGTTSGPADERSVTGILRSTPLLVAVYGLMFLTNLLLYANVVYYPPLLEGFGIETPVVISLYLSVLGLSGGVSAALYDRIRKRFAYQELAGIAFGLWTVAFVLATVASSALLAVVPMVLYGLGQGLVFPTVLLWVEELVPQSYQGRFSSYVAMAGYIGQFLSPVLFGPIVAGFGIRGVFASAAVAVGAGLLVVVGASRRRSRPTERRG